jgi:hypothetical protein
MFVSAVAFLVTGRLLHLSPRPLLLLHRCFVLLLGLLQRLFQRGIKGFRLFFFTIIIRFFFFFFFLYLFYLFIFFFYIFLFLIIFFNFFIFSSIIFFFNVECVREKTLLSYLSVLELLFYRVPVPHHLSSITHSANKQRGTTVQWHEKEFEKRKRRSKQKETEKKKGSIQQTGATENESVMSSLLMISPRREFRAISIFGPSSSSPTPQL